MGDLNHANELVSLVREHFGDSFVIEVAAYPEMHPQAANFDANPNNFKRKVDAGANSAITQYFYNADAYSAFIDACQRRDVEIPIVPGIMPITNQQPGALFRRLRRGDSTLAAQAPRKLRRRHREHRQAGDRGRQPVMRQLLDMGAPGLHFYTMNQAAPTLAVWDNLRLTARRAVPA